MYPARIHLQFETKSSCRTAVDAIQVIPWFFALYKTGQLLRYGLEVQLEAWDLCLFA